MIDIVQERLLTYNASSEFEEENAIKEILQEIALYALWRANFFDKALFRGGTSIRILHGLPRFSEGLDFMLGTPDPTFEWSTYLDSFSKTFCEFGLRSEVLPRARTDKRVRNAVIKDNSVASQLDLTFADRHPDKKVRIRLEIDVEPPPHSGEARSYLDFPLDHLVRHQDLESNFALKIHALLCRGFLKGRDWFDFSWYVSKGVFPNLPHLQAALSQFGPWSEKTGLQVDSMWLENALGREIGSVEWSRAAEDVRRFLRPAEPRSLDLWGIPLFTSKLEELMANATRENDLHRPARPE